jgi:hypothetical protein
VRDHPDTPLLVATARRTLLEQIVPQLPAEARGTALMIARALAVVAARVEVDAAAATAIEGGAEIPELAALGGLLGLDAAGARRISGTREAAIRYLSRELQLRIRGGDFDPPGERHQALQDFTFAITRAKLRESNPKALEASAADDGDL